MEVEILGAHNAETREAKLTCFVVDGVLAIDVGALTSGLSLAQQQKIRSILLTHQHFDHSRDLVTFGMNISQCEPVKVYALQQTLEVINSCLLDGRIYINFAEFPSKDKPCLQLHQVEPNKEVVIEGYRCLPVPTVHPVPNVGYQVTSEDGKSIFYTGDTGPGLTSCWDQISPQLLLIEVSGLNKYQDFLERVGHLSAHLLKEELIHFRQVKGYLPHVVVIHISPRYQNEIEQEIAEITQELGTNIDIGYEGMKIRL